MRALTLNGTWQLTWAEGSHLLVPAHYTAPTLRGRGLLQAPVPAPIHQVLRDAGLLDDPNWGMNSLKARWVEEMFWIYRHTFIAPAEAAHVPAWLIFEKLEYDAEVILNGEVIGHHANAHRPARFDVTGKVQAGENLLVVKLGTGLHSTADKQGMGYESGEIGLLTKRHWLRKPQYQSGWDWHPRLGNVGILGDVRLEWSSVPRLDEVTVFAVPDADLSRATVTVRATLDNPGNTSVAGTLTAHIRETGDTAILPLEIAPGESRPEVAISLPHPRLWWPREHGEQNLYTIEANLQVGDESQTAVRRTGIRRVEIDQSAHPVTGRHFIVTINNRPVFLKGGNWVPPDMLYSTVTPKRYRTLVDLAVEANFNALRIWGGGTFADPALCDACDETGVLIWHDLLFACAKYPGMDPEFAAEVRREVTCATRAMAHHPSLIVWCGNNEIEWGDWAWGYDKTEPTHPHYALFHHDLPNIVAAEDPSKAYWISSPSSPDGFPPNDPTVGDQHPWTVSMEAGGADWWKYRANVDRFPNEGGVMGASSPATLRQFLPESERRLLSPTWEHHDNPFAAMDTVPGALGHAYQTVELWTGKDPLAMEWGDYAFASALLQAEGLQEYITNYRRRMFSSASAIFWMYNDSWPVTHGWTIVDYYLRKKLAYHPVRRAFQPITVVIAEEEGEVTVYGVNDTPDAWSGSIRYGLFTLAGEYPSDISVNVTLPANASIPLGSFKREAWDTLGLEQCGAFAVLTQGEALVAQHRLFLARFKDLEFREPQVSVTRTADTVTLASAVFAWGVCLDVDGEAPLADNCFDLLPGIPYTVPWWEELGEPRIAAIGSRDAI
ncbi:MAG: beta-mannosidase [Armatimonadota bacterium]